MGANLCFNAVTTLQDIKQTRRKSSQRNTASQTCSCSCKIYLSQYSDVTLDAIGRVFNAMVLTGIQFQLGKPTAGMHEYLFSF